MQVRVELRGQTFVWACGLGFRPLPASSEHGSRLSSETEQKVGSCEPLAWPQHRSSSPTVKMLEPPVGEVKPAGVRVWLETTASSAGCCLVFNLSTGFLCFLFVCSGLACYSSAWDILEGTLVFFEKQTPAALKNERKKSPFDLECCVGNDMCWFIFKMDAATLEAS